jgi:hypothetical protein
VRQVSSFAHQRGRLQGWVNCYQMLAWSPSPLSVLVDSQRTVVFTYASIARRPADIHEGLLHTNVLVQLPRENVSALPHLYDSELSPFCDDISSCSVCAPAPQRGLPGTPGAVSTRQYPSRHAFINVLCNVDDGYIWPSIVLERFPSFWVSLIRCRGGSQSLRH